MSTVLHVFSAVFDGHLISIKFAPLVALISGRVVCICPILPTENRPGVSVKLWMVPTLILHRLFELRPTLQSQGKSLLIASTEC